MENKVQIRKYDNFTDVINVTIEVQEMKGYEKLFCEKVNREEANRVVEDLKAKYPNYEYCEFKI